MVLVVESLSVGYDGKPVLSEVNLSVHEGTVCALIGRNGCGKSTLLRGVLGDRVRLGGSVRLGQIRLSGRNMARNVRKGIGYSPQGQRVFGSMTAYENILLGVGSMALSERESRVRDVVDWLPELRPLLPRIAGRLSGGDQQLVNIARCLVLARKLALFDEPSLSLGRGRLKAVFAVIKRFAEISEVPVLLAEHRVWDALDISETACVLANGRIVHSGPAQELRDDPVAVKFLLAQ